MFGRVKPFVTYRNALGHSMNRVVGIIKCASILALLSVMSACNAQDIRIELLIDERQLSSGRMVVIATLKNESESSIILLPWNTPFDSQLSGPAFMVTDLISGESLQYQGKMVKRRAPTEEDYLTVLPGQQLVNSLDITEAYRFCAEKRYQIAPSETIFDKNYESIQFATDAIKATLGDAFNKC